MKKLLIVGALVAMSLGGWLTFVRTPPPVPLLSAALEVLAENELEGYCSGFDLMAGGGKEAIHQCWVDEEANWNIERNVHEVIPAFCEGIVAAEWPGNIYECKDIVKQYDLWPIRDGGMAMEWSESYPYPTSRPEEQKINNKSNLTRTGDREENSR